MVRKMYYSPLDLWDTISGSRDEFTPPRGKIFIGPGDYRKLGEKLKNDFIHYGGLKPEHDVLDIGCGIGRIAVPLTSYLTGQGSYEGFDIVQEGIDWCQKKISSKYSNFNFKHIDLRNDLYNLKTEQGASDFKFPYPDESFDFIVLTSVFTHMQPDAVQNYLNEISRVMRKEAKCFATFFIIDEHAAKYLKSQGEEAFFKFDFEGYLLHDEKVKDANIAYKEPKLTEMLKNSQLNIEAHHRGWWSGGDKLSSVDFQDVLIIVKA